jgi:hypothetical protein
VVVELPDIVSLGKPRRWDVPSYDARPWPIEIPFGRYALVRRIPSGEGDETYLGLMRGVAGFERLVFVRRFAASRMDAKLIDAMKRQAYVMQLGVATIFELGVHEEWGFVIGELVPGASIADIAREGERVGQRVPWLVALALVHDACKRFLRIRTSRVGPNEEAAPDLALSAARILLSTEGLVTFCLGVPAPTVPPWHRAVCDIIAPILALAASDEERGLLRELFADDNPDAVWVASDLLVQRHPELDPVLPIVFLSLAGRVDRVTAHAALVERVPIEQLRALWDLVAAILLGNRR